MSPIEAREVEVLNMTAALEGWQQQFHDALRQMEKASAPTGVHEIKHDGFRMLVRRDGDSTRQSGTRRAPRVLFGLVRPSRNAMSFGRPRRKAGQVPRHPNLLRSQCPLFTQGQFPVRPN
jgi:hypothetical protein